MHVTIPDRPGTEYNKFINEAISILELAKGDKITQTGKLRLIKAAISALEEAK